MRLRSTGLGKTELEARLMSIDALGDALVFSVKVVRPVKWRTRMLFDQKDMRWLVKEIVKPSNFVFVLKSLVFGRNKKSEAEDF